MSQRNRINVLAHTAAGFNPEFVSINVNKDEGVVEITVRSPLDADNPVPGKMGEQAMMRVPLIQFMMLSRHMVDQLVKIHE